MSDFVYRHFLPLLLALALGLAEAPARAFSLDAPSADQPPVLCTPESTGEWIGDLSSGDMRLHEHCDVVRRCVEENLRNQVTNCKKNGNCTPLAVHRQLARLGCRFEPDEFWLPADAQLVAIRHAPRAPTASLQWTGQTCRKGEKEAIQNGLNESEQRKSSRGRWLALQTLLSHGCNVEVSKLDIADGFEHVELRRNEDGRAGATGIVPQPVMTVTFKPLPPAGASGASAASGASVPQASSSRCELGQVQMCVPSTNEAIAGDIPICTALQNLSDAKQFALCIPPADDYEVRVRFVGAGGPERPYERGVQIVGPETGKGPPYCFTLPSGTPGDWQSLPCSGSTELRFVIVDGPPVASSPVLSTGAAAGSIGLGAVLAAVVKWLLGLLKKKREPDSALVSTLASHEAHDVQVIITFPDASRTRTRRKGN